MTILDTVAQILALAEKYGLSLVLLIVMGIGLAYVLIWNAKKYDAILKTVLDVRDNVPDTTTESVEKVTRLNRAIRNLLKEILLDFQPDWIHLWQFHNGSRVIGKARIPFMFISCTHELCSAAVDPVQTQFVQVPMSMVDNMIFVLIDNPLLVEKSNEAGYADNPVTQVMFDKGVKVQELLQIKDENGNLVAVLELCFITPPIFDDFRRNHLKGYAQRMGIILATYDDHKPDL